jgi:putative transposase
MYLAIVMDLYSRRIVGWQIEKRMTKDLISKAIIKAVNVRQPKQGLVFNSDRGSQYTSGRFGNLLKGTVFVSQWVMWGRAGTMLWWSDSLAV